uniref:Uncharacterized protein n=1 Tax=Schizaphis graminum TaxID=13262 RepID=A0A2S2PS49_SCHGA
MHFGKLKRARTDTPPTTRDITEFRHNITFYHNTSGLPFGNAGIVLYYFGRIGRVGRNENRCVQTTRILLCVISVDAEIYRRRYSGYGHCGASDDVIIDGSRKRRFLRNSLPTDTTIVYGKRHVFLVTREYET